MQTLRIFARWCGGKTSVTGALASRASRPLPSSLSFIFLCVLTANNNTEMPHFSPWSAPENASLTIRTAARLHLVPPDRNSIRPIRRYVSFRHFRAPPAGVQNTLPRFSHSNIDANSVSDAALIRTWWNSTAKMEIRPNQTIYINNLNEKIKKEGALIVVVLLIFIFLRPNDENHPCTGSKISRPHSSPKFSPQLIRLSSNLLLGGYFESGDVHWSGSWCTLASPWPLQAGGLRVSTNKNIK